MSFDSKRLRGIRNVVVHLTLILMLPSFILYPQAHIPAVAVPAQENIEKQPGEMRFDDIINLINTIEDGALEQNCSPDELERINCFLAALAKEGIIPDDEENESVLENDIQKLISEEDRPYEYILDRESGYNIISAAFLKNSPSLRFGRNSGEVVLCKSWASKRWKHTRHFVKKHKKAILIGAAIVVAATVVVCAVAAVSAASAAAAAASQKNEKSSSGSNAEEQAPPADDAAPSLDTANEAPIVKEVIDEKVSSFKEHVADDVVLESLAYSKDPAFGDKTREIGSLLAHETLDGIAEMAAVVPGLFEEIKEFGGKILPEISGEQNPLLQGSPKENYDRLVSDWHQKIDQAFATDQAALYSPEAKATGDLTLGILPPPGSFLKGINAGRFQEIISAGQDTAVLADELGFSAREIARLQQSGSLERAVGATYEAIVNDRAMLESCERFKVAKEFLKPYQGQYLSETQARELIHQCGIRTFPRPAGIPENFRVKLTGKGAGILYVHPKNDHISVRVMPGKPHSPFPHQRSPYVVHRKHGDTLDKFGNIVASESPEAHIPYSEFIYMGD